MDKVCDGTRGNVLNIALQSQVTSTEALKRLRYLWLFWIPIDCSSNGDDEGKECKNKNSCSLGCQPNGKCVVLPNGPTCVCPKGFEYIEKTQQCEVHHSLASATFLSQFKVSFEYFRMSMSAWNSAFAHKAVWTHLGPTNALALLVSDWPRIIERAKHRPKLMLFYFMQPAKRLIGSHSKQSIWNELPKIWIKSSASVSMVSMCTGRTFPFKLKALWKPKLMAVTWR